MYKAYLVTVKPAMVVYTGNHAGGEYTVTVNASSRANAIKQARAERRDNEGSQDAPVRYTAHLAA